MKYSYGIFQNSFWSFIDWFVQLININYMFSRQKWKLFIITQIIVRLCTWEPDICTWSKVAHGETKQFHLVWYGHICFPVLNDEPFSSLSHWSNGNRGKCISSRGKHKYKDRKVFFFLFSFIFLFMFLNHTLINILLANFRRQV